MIDKIGRYAIPLSGIFINLIATGYATINPAMGKELFTLYGITAAGMYGYSQQSRIQEIDDNPREQEGDS